MRSGQVFESIPVPKTGNVSGKVGVSDLVIDLTTNNDWFTLFIGRKVRLSKKRERVIEPGVACL